jgi:pimeloyl-ACP methyl ester carboxylesterase
MTSAPESPYLLARYRGEPPPAPAWFDAALAHAPQRSRFTSQGASIELLTWGERGRPGLLFLHGAGAHAGWWSPLAPFFARDLRCATFSFSGMGRSDRREAGYVPMTFAQEARDAIDAAELYLGGRPIVIGHSMGSLVGILALAGRSLARGLILIDSPLGMSPARASEALSRAPKAYRAPIAFNTPTEALARFRLSPSQDCANAFMVDHIARGGLVEDDGRWLWHFDPRGVTFPNVWSEPPVDQVDCPIAYLYGDRSALINTDTLTRTVARLPAASPVVAIPDAAHQVLLDQPLPLIAALRALLASWPVEGGHW